MSLRPDLRLIPVLLSFALIACDGGSNHGSATTVPPTQTTPPPTPTPPPAPPPETKLSTSGLVTESAHYLSVVDNPHPSAPPASPRYELRPDAPPMQQKGDSPVYQLSLDQAALLPSAR